VLLSAQQRLRGWLERREAAGAGVSSALALPLIGAANAYGGYFGAGASVIVLAALGLSYTDTLRA